MAPRRNDRQAPRRHSARACIERSAWCRRFRLFAVLGLFVQAAHAEALFGTVVGVSDGDTLTILDADNRQHKVRLDSIDAPEIKQAFGQRSKQSLSDICAGKAAEVAEQGKDRYGRTIGRVTCAHVDANSEQVRRGMAWVYDRYAKHDSPLYALQWDAQEIRRGLWVDPRAVAPWEWRASAKKRS